MTAHDRAERALARALREHDRDHDFAPRFLLNTLMGSVPL